MFTQIVSYLQGLPYDEKTFWWKLRLAMNESGYVPDTIENSTPSDDLMMLEDDENLAAACRRFREKNNLIYLIL